MREYTMVLSTVVTQRDYRDAHLMAREQHRNVSQIIRMLLEPEIERWRKERQEKEEECEGTGT